MIRVTVEVLPQGNPARAEKIGELLISNQSGMASPATYLVSASGNNYSFSGTFTHDRRDSVWALIRKALRGRG